MAGWFGVKVVCFGWLVCLFVGWFSLLFGIVGLAVVWLRLSVVLAMLFPAFAACLLWDLLVVAVLALGCDLLCFDCCVVAGVVI